MGAGRLQFADLYMPDEPSPYQKDEGIPCVMLIHGGFWRKKFTLDLMAPIAEDLAEQGIAAWNIEFKGWEDGDEGVWMDTLSDVMRAPGANLRFYRHRHCTLDDSGPLCRGPSGIDDVNTAERKPWLTIAQAPIADIVAADHAKLSDGGDAVVVGWVVPLRAMRSCGVE